MTIFYSPLAKSDLTDIHTYLEYEFDNKALADNCIKATLKRIRMLETFPEMGASLSNIVNVETDYRYLVCEKSVAIYKTHDDTVEIIRILSDRRDYMKVLFGK